MRSRSSSWVRRHSPRWKKKAERVLRGQKLDREAKAITVKYCLSVRRKTRAKIGPVSKYLHKRIERISPPAWRNW